MPNAAIPTVMLVSAGRRNGSGLVDVWDGAAEFWWVNDLDDHATRGVLVVVEIDRSDVNEGTAVDVTVTGPSGDVVASATLDSGPLALDPNDPRPMDAPVVLPLLAGLDWPVQDVGVHEVTAVHRASGATGHCRFWVRLRPTA